MSEQAAVLFVDDEQRVLDGFVRGLRKEPFVVITTTNPLEALEILEKQSIDMVVADHNMPNMNGSTFLNICRERWPDVIRIMLTGGASLEAALSVTFGGWVYQYLEKPIMANELAAIINDALLAAPNHASQRFAHLVLSNDVQQAIKITSRITSSPDRPTFMADTSSLEWAQQLCETDALPPELDRLRPLISALSEIADIAMRVGDTDESAHQLKEIQSKLIGIY